jgi:hypothetical protein
VRKRFVLIITVVLLAAVSSPIYAAVPKAGASCTKVGTNAISAGKKYTCIKSGKKLVWDKGVAIATPVPAPTPTPTPTPTPVATPTQPPVPTGFNDLEANYSGVSFAAWKKSKDKILASSSTSIPFELLLGANSKLNYKTPEYAISQVNKLFAGNILPKKIVFLAFGFQDRDWAISQMDQIVPNAGSQWIKDVACPSVDSCIGGGSFHNLSNKTALIVITTGIDPNNISNTISGTLEAHEYTHSIEQSSSDALRPSVNLLKSPWPPNWYWEGLAQFSQHAAIYSDSFEEYSKYRKMASGGILNNPIWNAKYIESYFQTNLTNEWAAQYPRWRQYDLGAMLVEILVSIKGPDSAMEMFRESINGSGFESAFQKIYGYSFQSVLPIISRTIALELGN